MDAKRQYTNGKKWTAEDIDKFVTLYVAKCSIDEIAESLGRTPCSIYRAMNRHGIRAKKNISKSREEMQISRYAKNALAGLRHCKDLRAAGYDPGFGELRVTPDGIPQNYQTRTLVSSVYGSSAALCAEIGG